LKWFGFILPVFFAMVGSAAYFKLDAQSAAYVLWGVGGLATALYAFVRPLRFVMYIGWMHLFFPLGWTISHVVLSVLFYGIVTPMAAVMRLIGFDPMKRKLERDAESYWIEEPTGDDPARYLRQY
jgi:hypothetical protein